MECRGAILCARAILCAPTVIVVPTHQHMYSLAGRYNPLPTQFIDPIDCYIWGLGTEWEEDYRIGPPGRLEELISLELIPELLKSLKIRSLFSIRRPVPGVVNKFRR